MTRPLNPFDPSRPIDPVKFVGRSREVRELEAALSHAKRDRPRHFLITGERGVGKTSFLNYIRKKAVSYSAGGEFNFAVVDFAVNRQTTRLDFARALKSQLDSIVSAHPTHRETLSRVWAFVQNFEAAGISYRPDRVPENHRDMYQEVADSLCEIVKRICTSTEEQLVAGSDGILILIDEVDLSSDELDVGSFLKFLLERLNRKGCHKVIVGLAGLSGTTEILVRSHPSSLRIFDELALTNLSAYDANELLDEAQVFVRDDGVGEFGITQGARDALLEFSGGHPHMLHQFGYCAFEAAYDRTNGGELTIEARDVIAGAFEIRGALDLIGDMYFRKQFEAIEDNFSALAVVDYLSENGASETVSELAQQITLADCDVRSAVHLLQRTGILMSVTGARFVIRHRAFAYWVKTHRPQPA